MTYKEAADTLRKLPECVYSRKMQEALAMAICALDQKEQKVFCKDCKHFTEHTVNGKPTEYGYCRYFSYSLDCCDYCSFGERRADD